MNIIHKPDHLKNEGISNGDSLKLDETLSDFQAKSKEIKDADRAARESLDTRKGFGLDRSGRVNNYAVVPKTYLQKEPRFGFTRFAEVWNGRLAMIGFMASIITEAIAGKSLFAYWFGLG
jgi:hypothetical protein